MALSRQRLGQAASLWVREVMVELRPEGKEVKVHPGTGINSTSKGPVARGTRWTWGRAREEGKPWATHVGRWGQAPQSPPGPTEEHWGGPNGLRTRRRVYLRSLSFHILKAVLQLQHTEWRGSEDSLVDSRLLPWSKCEWNRGAGVYGASAPFQEQLWVGAEAGMGEQWQQVQDTSLSSQWPTVWLATQGQTRKA